MKRLIPYLVLAGALLPVWGAEDDSQEKPSYTLSSASAAPILHYTSAEGEPQPENTWLASNNVVTAFSCVLTNGTEAISQQTIAGNPQVRLTASEVGFAFERIKPEVWFGGQIPLPTDTDWTATYEYYKESAEEQAAFIFDPQNHRVFAKKGGTETFTWFLKDGTKQSHAYIISSTCEGRPYRLFWTDSPYNAPPVSLSGRYIQLFGPESIIKPTYGTQVVDQGGQQITNNNVILSGVFLDTSSSCLYARGKVSGQFIVAFYDSGSYDNLQRIQVVEVGSPDVNYMTGYIGEPIQPYGMGYDTSGLIPSPVEIGTTAQDASGPYYYQHKGTYSYSPKNNWVYPLRTTTGEAWRLDVYWMETDAHGIQWPFERCNYSCSWNTNQMTTLITGAKVKLPQDYSVTLGGFQEPEGHALAPENQIFRTQKSGFSLLKVSGTDNIWFIPVRSIDRTDTNFFTLEEANWFVGDELRPRGGSVSGTSETYNPVIDSTVSGLLNLDESGNNYNPNLYYDRTTTSNTLASVIYPVNTVAESDKPLEVWWSSTVQQEGMSTPIAFPSLVQRYRAIWPDVNQVPQIVIASQQGGAGTTRYDAGSAASFTSGKSIVNMPDLYAFNERGGSISFWINAAKSYFDSGRILTLGTGGDTKDLKVYVDAERKDDKVAYNIFMSRSNVSGDTFNLETTALSTNEWHKIVFSFAPSNLTAFVDGKFNASTNFIGFGSDEVTSFGGKLSGNYMGGTSTSKRGFFIDNVALWARTFDESTVSSNLYASLTGTESALTCAFTFDGDDLELLSGTDKRKATDIVTGRTYDAENVLRATPGAPILGNGVFTADTTPIVYRQPDKTKTGYNPNEEHAFVTSGAGGYYAWALRCDLNTDETSKPFVLVQYEKDGEAKMECYSVLLTNQFYTALAANVEAGHLLPGPHPLDLFDNPWCTNDYWDVVSGQAYSSAYRDRKGQVWARAAGTIPIHMYYPNQDGFDFPSLSTTPAVGVPIPWLSELDRTPSSYMLNNKPAKWTWTVTWPTGVPTMRIGETLTTAANGLPEVWSAKSMAVLWPQGNTDTVKLWDPTVARESGKTGYDKVADFLSNYGFSIEAGNVQLRAGKYTFKELPPSIGSRFYADTTKDSSKCLTLIGELESSAGGTILWPNVANAAEIAALKGLISTDADSSKRNEWAAIIDGLTLTTPIQPTTIEGTLDPVATYIPRDHYALTAMGGTGYVTIIENDAPVGSGVGQLGVQDGDAISMHVFAVTNKYYTGRVVAREDQENLLSQQLSILYTESFAGTADDYEFEWKKATPTASGAMPTDYTNAYQRAFSNADEMRGLTRFTLGGQGDTLANLVNTFYVMRYRAVSGAAKASMGDTWSDWCGPTLAEGWIQRVVNNVTPFTQRMTDLYENEAETLSSMIQQAGGPYMGDVALNQDNLTSVGLIQLYQTLLNKAESISIASGSTGVNDAEVNKQLLLAAERLADLYMVLGNDAYADALNPTIGFGTTWGETAAGISQIDYGAESTGLFCFDNQVNTLLEEELALLRGRSGANNPSVQTAPFYNRLVWNFTRGITAGEVAYAVNYNINSSNNDAKINEDDAALQYPQGHGDAWGHYLSAITTFYRLLRNPNFTWPVSQSQMLVADAVVDVDYYDEERFAEIANKLAVTAADVVDRTARKAWKDNGGANGAGYLDEDTNRNFGYGEWATRGAIGGVANWMVANAILPETESSDSYSRLMFDKNTFLYNTNIQLRASSDFSSGWTFEFQVAAPTNTTIIGEGSVLSLVGSFDSSIDTIPLGEPATDGVTATQGFLLLSATGDGKANLLAENRCYYVIPVTNMVDVVETNAQGVISTKKVEAVDYEVEANIIKIADTENEGEALSLPDNAIVAIDRAVSGAMTLRILDVNGEQVESVALGATLQCECPMAIFGGGFTGTVGEIRGWKTTRSNAQLQSARAYVNARDENLLFYTRGTTRRTTDTELADETPGGDIPWTIQNPNWVSVKDSGLALAFDDDGLLRINRDTVTDLTSIPTSVASIQNTLDGLDAGMNPLGLSDSAVPFDISSTGVAEGTSTHFEQIAARAEKSLGNAAKMLDRAQSASKYLRQIQNATSDEEELAATSEKSYEAQLIEIFGTPYSGDIGPGKMYEQGYTGPDLYHYMYMDLSGYGLTSLEEASPKYVLYYNPSSTDKKWTYKELVNYMKDGENTYTNALVYCVSEYGIVVKPDSVTGSRSAYGRLQQAYSDYLLAYVDVRNAVAAYNEYTQLLKVAYETEESIWWSYNALYGMSVTLRLLTSINIGVQKVTQNAINAIEMVKEANDAAYQIAGNSVPEILVAGLSVGFSPKDAVKLVVGNANVVIGSAIGGSKLSLQTIQSLADFIVSEIENGRNGAQDAVTWNDAQLRCWDTLYDAASKVRTAAKTVKTAVAKLNSLTATFDTLVAEGNRILAAREAERAKRVNRIIKLRYNDMFFRQVQDEALTGYSAAYNLAQRQVFMAAQTYDYETAQLTSDKESGDAFKAEIIGARALGTFDSNGKPQVGSGHGDAGLSDILARMEANYDVLKPRLGINNPDSNATWFSLRHELFRIDTTEAGLANWQKELQKYVVADLRQVPEYNRFCQPVASSSGLSTAEPALVIPFETTIDYGKNLFGRDLDAADHSLDSSYYATKIRSTGVRFKNYNAALVEGASGALAATPVVYLVPAGVDRMRVPGDLKGTVVDSPVVDQVIPVPYTIGSTALDDIDYTALASSYTGCTEPSAKIRRIPSFRAMTGSADDADRANTRLIGRSAWNTRWVLIIPAGQLLGGSAENKAKALDIFINGADTNNDGILEVSPVTDIELGLKTYSHSGN